MPYSQSQVISLCSTFLFLWLFFAFVFFLDQSKEILYFLSTFSEESTEMDDGNELLQSVRKSNSSDYIDPFNKFNMILLSLFSSARIACEVGGREFIEFVGWLAGTVWKESVDFCCCSNSNRVYFFAFDFLKPNSDSFQHFFIHNDSTTWALKVETYFHLILIKFLKISKTFFFETFFFRCEILYLQFEW